MDNPFEALANLSEQQLTLLEKILAHVTGDPKALVEIEKPMSCEETAEFLNIRVSTLYTLRSKGAIPSHKRFGKVYFLKSELLDYIKNSPT